MQSRCVYPVQERIGQLLEKWQRVSIVCMDSSVLGDDTIGLSLIEPNGGNL